MPPTTLSKGFKAGWSSGETGWDADVNEDLRRLNALIIDHWGQERATSVGLTYGFVGGLAFSAGVLAQVAGGTLALTPNATNYVERTIAGAVSGNTTAFTAGRIPMAKIVVGASTITSIEDWRTTSLFGLNGDWDGRNATWSGTHSVTGLSTATGGLSLPGTATGVGVAVGIDNGSVSGNLALRATGVIYLVTNGIVAWSIATAGHLEAGTDATFDIGQPSTLRPRHVYISGQYNGSTQVLTQTSNSSVDLATITNASPGASSAAVHTATADTIIAEAGASKLLGGTFIGSRSAHAILVRQNGATIWQWSASGHLLAAVDNTFDIGAAGATRPRNVYIAGTLAAAGAVSLASTLAVTGASTLTGLVTASNGLVATAGGVAVAAGGLTVTAGGVAVTAGGLAITAGGLSVTAGSAKAARSSGSNWTGSVSEDLSTANTFERTLAGNTTLTLTNPTAGTWYTFVLLQDGTGGRTVTWPGTFKWNFNSPPALSTANKIDMVSAYWNGTNYLAFIAGQGI